MNVKLWLIAAVVPGMVANMGNTKTEHLVRGTGRVSATLNFIREHPLAHDIENPTPKTT